FPQPFLRSIGLGAILVAAIAGASSLLVLPAILTLLGARVGRSSSRVAQTSSSSAASPGIENARFWPRLSRLVVRRPDAVAIAAAVVMISLAVPLLGVRITQVDANVVPSGSGARVVDEAIAARFPPASHAPIFIVVRA